jgi:hypothetical protein
MRKNAMTDASDAQWAVAVARERVIRFLAAQSPIRRSDIDAAGEELHLSRAMLHRLLSRYRRHPHTAALVVGPPGLKTGSQNPYKRFQPAKGMHASAATAWRREHLRAYGSRSSLAPAFPRPHGKRCSSAAAPHRRAVVVYRLATTIY